MIAARDQTPPTSLWVSCAAAMGALCAVAAHGAETTSTDLAERRAGYDRQISAYNEMYDKVERGSVSAAQWQAGQDLREFGLETLRELNWSSALRSLSTATKRELESSQEAAGPLPSGAPNAFLTTRGMLETMPGGDLYSALMKAVDEVNRFNALPDSQKTSKARLDVAIAEGEAISKILLGGDKVFGTNRQNSLKHLNDGIMSGLHLAAGFASAGDDAAKKRHFAKFLQHSSEATLRQALISNPSLTGPAMVARVNGELLARFSVAGASQFLGTKLVREAELMKENTLSDLRYRMMVADYERDKVIAAQRRAERQERIKEPGGIKFSRQRADDLSLKLDITSIDYDPVRGRLVLSGEKTGQEEFDLATFSDVLRLAIEEHEPFFSMEPSNIADWDFTPTRFAEGVRRKYTVANLAAKVKALSPLPIVQKDRTFYYATTYDLDPELFASVNEGKDISEKLIFSPNWLRYSQIGWTLYEADMAIKGIAAGFLERWPAVIPSPAWDTPDFNPDWLIRDGAAGRANFELDEASILDANGRLSLGQIRPKLYVTHRKPGTTEEDSVPPPAAQAISDHFTRNWEKYVAEVPELRRLQTVYKMYVAARYVVRDHPGLAERIRALPRTTDWPEQPPLRVIRPSVIRVAYRGERLVPIDDETRAPWDIGGGYGGGAVFKYQEKIAASPSANVPKAWSSAVLLSSSSTADVDDQGTHGAIAFEIGDEPLSLRPWRSAAIVGAGLALIAAVLAAVFKVWDWQQLSLRPTCPHCANIHRLTGLLSLPGHAAGTIGLGILAGLPLATALSDVASNEESLFVPAAAAVLVTLGALAVVVLIGTGIQAWIGRFRAGPMAPPSFLTAFFAGTQILGVFVLPVLLYGSLFHGTSGYSYMGLLGRDLGERLMIRLGGVDLIVWGLWILACGQLILLAARWAVPFALGSRPLLLSRIHGHQHRTA